MLRKMPSILDVLRRAARVVAEGFAALGRAALAAGEVIATVAQHVVGVVLDVQRRADQWAHRPVPDAGRWVLRALPSGVTS
jgi:negative regulator of sigma E activity